MAPILVGKNYTFPEKKDIKIGVGDIELTSLDENAAGFQNMNNNG